MTMKTLLFTILIFISPLLVVAQDIMDGMYSGSIESGRQHTLFTEKIQLISHSRKIFIISNNNQKLTKGDFISLLLDQSLAVRALVAKIDGSRAGIKILKIYSMSLWNKMASGKDVQILIGDDSYYKKPEEKKEENFDQIKNEEDLFKDDLDIDDFGDEDQGVRNMRTDNIISLAWGNLHGINADDEIEQHKRFSFTWAHQISDNIYLEGMYGYTKVTNFPSQTGIQTVVHTLGVRAKYSFKTPLYTFTMPFVGFEYFNVDSPEAGKGEGLSAADAAAELRRLDNLLPSKSQVVFGVTLIRRLVPAWFLKAEVEFSTKGKVYYFIGAAIEF